LSRSLSESHVVHSEIEVKFWLETIPSVDRVRPSCCPRCKVASRPPGGRVEVVGHGLRDRQVRGRLAVDERARLVVVRVRRFLCLACGAVITVVPAGVAARRHFGAGSIGLALRYLGRGEVVRRIRDALGGVGPPDAGGWITLRRWAEAVRRGTLLPRLPPLAIRSPRVRAAQAAAILSTYAAPSLATAPVDTQVFAGAERLARAA
jgi:hypothetical protein